MPDPFPLLSPLVFFMQEMEVLLILQELSNFLFFFQTIRVKNGGKVFLFSFIFFSSPQH